MNLFFLSLICIFITCLVIFLFRSHVFLMPAWFFPHKRVRSFFHKLRGVNIGKNVEIGYMVHIDNLYPDRVYIGNNVTLVANSIIMAHDNSYRYSRGSKIVIGKVEICENAFIGANSIILPGVRIGKRAIVGAGSVVTRDVDDHSIVVGNPARIIKKI